MKNKIEWHDFSEEMPPFVDEFYIVEDTSGNIYTDKFILEPWTNCLGHVIDCDWRDTHRAYVKRWARPDGLSLKEYIELTEN